MANADGGAVFLLASGTRAGLTGPLAGEPWIVVTDVTRAEGRAAAGTGAIIRAAAAITEGTALQTASHLVTDRVEVTFADGRATARREQRVGAIVRSSAPVPVKGAPGAHDAVRRAIATDGLGIFRWTDGARELRGRLALLHRHLGEPWPDVSDDALLGRLDDWLAPEIDALAAGGSAAKADLTSALRRLLPWPEASRLDELVPERLAVPSGSRIRISYPDDADGQPVVAVKLQECFGLTTSPHLVNGRVPVLFHLLSPAGRPLAVTADLASFWAGPYAQVRAEMRGRYPKHPWPEDPQTALATAKTKKRLAEGS
nr:ATP-dependent helicase C-terminal domain-containing protein [Microbacterium gorillae]